MVSPQAVLTYPLHHAKLQILLKIQHNRPLECNGFGVVGGKIKLTLVMQAKNSCSRVLFHEYEYEYEYRKWYLSMSTTCTTVCTYDIIVC